MMKKLLALFLLPGLLSAQLGPTTITSPNPFTPPISVNAASPNPVAAPFNTPTMFNGRMTVKDQGFGTFTLGDYPRVGAYSAMGGPVNWNESKVRLGGQLGMPFNEWGLHVATNTPTTGSTTSYEKAGMFISSETADPSNYGSGISRDVVGADIRGSISGTALGRAWGINPWAAIVAGSDGLLTGIEVDVNNNGSRQDALSATTTKTGIITVSLGTYPSTVANGVVSSTTMNQWMRAYWSGEDYLLSTGSFLELTHTLSNTCDNFRVKPSGQTLVGVLCNNSSLNDYDSTVYGQFSAAGYMTVPATGNLAAEKQALYLLADSSVSKHRIGTTRYDNSANFYKLSLETGNNGTGLANEVELLTNDPFIQLTTSYAGGNLSAAGTVALRNHAGVLEMSENGAAWAIIAGSAGGLPDCHELSPTIYCTISGNAATYFQVENDTNGTAAQAVLTAAYGGGGANNILVGATSPLFATANNIPANAGYVNTNSGLTNGLYLQSLAGDVTIYPMSAVAKSEHDANAINYFEAVNTTAGTTSAAEFVAISNGTARRMYLGNTSSTFTTANNIPASAGFIDSGVDDTNGLFIQSEAGDVTIYPTSAVMKSQHNANAVNYLEAVNTTSGTSAAAEFVAISDQTSGKAYLGSTSSAYTVTNNFPAKVGFVDSGVDNTKGLYLQAEAGDVLLIGTQASYTATVGSTQTTVSLALNYSVANNTGSQAGFFAGNASEFDMCATVSSACDMSWGLNFTSSKYMVQVIPTRAGSPGGSGATGNYRWYVDSNDSSKLKVVGPSGTVTTIAVP